MLYFIRHLIPQPGCWHYSAWVSFQRQVAFYNESNVVASFVMLTYLTPFEVAQPDGGAVERGF